MHLFKNALLTCIFTMDLFLKYNFLKMHLQFKMHSLKENVRVRFYIPANSPKSAAPPQACRSLLLLSLFFLSVQLTNRSHLFKLSCSRYVRKLIRTGSVPFCFWGQPNNFVKCGSVIYRNVVNFCENV